MDTIVAKITNDSLTDKKIYEQAGKILREGGLVAFPTETVYGRRRARRVLRQAPAGHRRPHDHDLPRG